MCISRKITFKNSIKKYNCNNWEYFAQLSDQKLIDYCEISYFKGSGPGGQNRNKLSNGIKLNLFHFISSYSDNRELKLNKLYALRKLRFLFAIDLTPSYLNRPFNKDLFNKDSKGSSLFLVAENKPLYPIVCGYIIDSFIKNNGNWKDLSNDFNTSSSQLSKWFSNNYIIKQKLLDLRKIIKK